MLFATYVIPQTILFIPMYQVVLAFGLDDSPAALVVIYSAMALPFCVWLLSAYYANLPREIEESALVEGATRLGAFRRIMLPMSRNVLVASGLFTLGTVGQDFMLASVFLLDRYKQTVAAGLGVMDVSLEELVAVAGVNMAAIPVVILLHAGIGTLDSAFAIAAVAVLVALIQTITGSLKLLRDASAQPPRRPQAIAGGRRTSTRRSNRSRIAA